MEHPIMVAEFTTNHMGNLNILLEMVKEAKHAGASIIKMQKKDVETFYTQEKLNGSYPSPYGKTYRDYRSKFEFNLDDFKRFDEECKKFDIPWYTTIQDAKSFTFFRTNFPDMPMVKLASCNARNKELWALIKEQSDWTIVVSIGGQELETIDEIVEYFNDDRQVVIQQCTSTYPCPDTQLNLGNIPFLLDRYKDNINVKIGYSGHELGYIPSVLAASMGAKIIERHFCLSRDSFVHHIECSLEPDEFRDMVNKIGNLDEIMSSEFGMKESEKKFLIDNTYGTEDLQNDWNNK
jgi:sialic acid synthase SpsE